MKQVILTWTVYRISTHVSVNAIVLESMTWQIIILYHQNNHLCSGARCSKEAIWSQASDSCREHSMEGKSVWQMLHSQVRDNSQEVRQREQLLVSRRSHQEQLKLLFGSLVKWYLREHQWGGCAERNQAVNVAAGAEVGDTAGDWVRLPDSVQQWWWHMAKLFSTWCHHLWCTRVFKSDWPMVAWQLHPFCGLQVMPSSLSLYRN